MQLTHLASLRIVPHQPIDRQLTLCDKTTHVTSMDAPLPQQRIYALMWLALLHVVLLTGCASDQWARMRKIPRNPLVGQLDFDSRSGPRPSQRTMQTLRRYALDDKVDGPPEALLSAMQTIIDVEPNAENVYAISELAYISAKRVEGTNENSALDFFGMAVAHAYFYLFDEQYDQIRNPYDPQFRRVCDLYNASLDSALRIIQRRGMLIPGGTFTIDTERDSYEMSVAVRGTWHEENFAELKFVSDFEVEELSNRYHTFGLGVPMIAVYQPRDSGHPADRFYPPGMSFPVTAFLRVIHGGGTQGQRYRCVVELHDPLQNCDLIVSQRLVPLETDLTTPLAYSLDNPTFKKANEATRNLWSPEKTIQSQGLYLLEPFDPNKIPVVMVHGFWSSLVTWMEMYNDLRGFQPIRDRFQFWFYLYPTGEPFWHTAAHLRSELARLRMELDPNRHAASLDQMVLVGHSMGGLISLLQTIDSKDEVWRMVSDKPFDQLQVPADSREELQRTFYFQPNPSIQRVVTIATPHRGTTVSNSATQWLSRKIVGVPQRLESTRAEIIRANPDFFPSSSLFRVTNSVDSLAPESPILPVIAAAPRGPWVRYHNIIGLVDEQAVLGRVASGSDGVVNQQSARLEGAISEIAVTADHMSVHRQPKTILEVRRILLEHLSTIDQ